MSYTKSPIFYTCLIIALAIGMVVLVSFAVHAFAQKKQQQQQVTLTAMLEDQGDPQRWKSLLQPTIRELRTRHPDMNI